MDLTIVDQVHAMNHSADERPFPEVAMRLGAAGVQSYRVDLVRMEQTFYGRDGSSHRVSIEVDQAPPIASIFTADGVVAALHAIQRQEIRYPEFLRRIMAAGTASYCVFLGGRKAVYTGLDGGAYVEPFPASLQIPHAA